MFVVGMIGDVPVPDSFVVGGVAVGSAAVVLEQTAAVAGLVVSMRHYLPCPP